MEVYTLTCSRDLKLATICLASLAKYASELTRLARTGYEFKGTFPNSQTYNSHRYSRFLRIFVSRPPDQRYEFL